MTDATQLVETSLRLLLFIPTPFTCRRARTSTGEMIISQRVSKLRRTTSVGEKNISLRFCETFRNVPSTFASESVNARRIRRRECKR